MQNRSVPFCVYFNVNARRRPIWESLTGLYYSHITQTDGRPTVGEPKMRKSGDVGRLSVDVGTDFGRFFGRPTTFLSKHPS